MRVYDRNRPASLPARRMLYNSAPVPSPLVVDLRQWCGPVKDQGAEGACTAHAGTSANEWIHRKYLRSSPIFSPQYTYAKELILQGNFPQDEGSDGTTLCQSLVANGCCELSLYPYVAGKIEMPTAEQDANARGFRLGAYHGLIGSQVALSVLGDKTPWVVTVGFTVSESFESREVAESGIYSPSPNWTGFEKSLGGHEVLMVGYDVAPTPQIRPANCPPAALIQNSWGSRWGLDGFFWMDMAVLDAPDTDLKIAHSGGPWKQ